MQNYKREPDRAKVSPESYKHLFKVGKMFCTADILVHFFSVLANHDLHEMNQSCDKGGIYMILGRPSSRSEFPLVVPHSLTRHHRKISYRSENFIPVQNLATVSVV